MTGYIYLEIAIAVIFTILVFALIATSIQEVISGLLRWRSAALRQGVRRLLGDAFDEFWNAPLIDALRGPQVSFFKNSGKRDPSALDPKIFAKALLDELGLSNKTPEQIYNQLKTELSDTENTVVGREIRERLKAVVAGVEGEAAKAEEAVAEWFDTSMNRVSGWYVRRAQKTLFAIGLVLAAITNTDIVTYAQFLRNNDAARQAAVTRAEQIAALDNLDEAQKALTGKTADTGGIPAVEPGEAKEQIAELYQALTKELDGYEVRSGWGHCGKVTKGDEIVIPEGDFSWACFWTTTGLDLSGPIERYTPQDDEKGEPIKVENPVFAWILLAFGVMLGAQFWFDLLKQFMSIRAAGAAFLKKAAPKDSATT